MVGTLAGPAGTAVGAATGGLLGGTMGATVDLAHTGLKEDYIAALVAEAEEYSTQPVDEAVWRHDGVFFRHPTSYVTA